MNDHALYVRHDGKVPEDVVEVAARSAEQVVFFPAGGGFERLMPAKLFDRLHRLVAAGEFIHSPTRAQGDV